MNQKAIKNYDDFVSALLEAGFSMGGGNSEDVFSLITWNWDEQPPYDTPVRWHTGDPETDPWEWRMRVLDERDDIAYAKFFFKKSGYITKEWIPYFLTARRGNMLFEEAYEEGLISNYGKRIYSVVAEHEILPLHAIKQLAGFGKEEKSQFDRALIELQMKMYLTMCGRQQKISGKGEEYGWSSTVFCTTERYWGEEIFKESGNMEKAEAIEKITKQIYTLNQDADQKKVMRFIKG
ncbi:AlkZ-related protein [Lacrimispora brassicae]